MLRSRRHAFRFVKVRPTKSGMKTSNSWGNYVDVKVFHKDHIAFYEVKSAENATKCIKEALGQILLYTFNDDPPLQKKLYVVGQYAMTLNDEKYIEFIRENLNFDFEYIAVSIS